MQQKGLRVVCTHGSFVSLVFGAEFVRFFCVGLGSGLGERLLFVFSGGTGLEMLRLDV